MRRQFRPSQSNCNPKQLGEIDYAAGPEGLSRETVRAMAFVLAEELILKLSRQYGTQAS